MKLSLCAPDYEHRGPRFEQTRPVATPRTSRLGVNGTSSGGDAGRVVVRR